MTDLAVIVPTRGRPVNIARLFEAWRETKAEAQLVYTWDEDDDQGIYYEGLCEDHAEGWPLPRTNMVGSLNWMANWKAASYKYIGFMGDDHLPRTPHWDTIICDELAQMDTGIVYGDDLFQGPNLPTAVFMTSNIVQALGYMAPPGLKHLYVDNAWRDWGQGIKKFKYIPEVVIEHMHPQANKAEWDEGHTRVNGSEMWEHDCEAYRVYCAEQENADLEKLRAL